MRGYFLNSFKGGHEPSTLPFINTIFSQYLFNAPLKPYTTRNEFDALTGLEASDKLLDLSEPLSLKFLIGFKRIIIMPRSYCKV